MHTARAISFHSWDQCVEEELKAMASKKQDPYYTNAKTASKRGQAPTPRSVTKREAQRQQRAMYRDSYPKQSRSR